MPSPRAPAPPAPRSACAAPASWCRPDVMANVPGWADAAERMNAAYPAPTEDDAVWADAIVFGTPTRFGWRQPPSCGPTSTAWVARGSRAS